MLVVEDEPRVAATVEYLLGEEGFDVALADDGAAALHALEGSPYAALLTDVRLGPGPDGWAVAREARARAPALPVIYMTADSAADWAGSGVAGSLLLQKPFTPRQMLRALSELLSP